MLGWETGLNMDNIVMYRLVLTQELSKLAPPGFEPARQLVLLGLGLGLGLGTEWLQPALVMLLPFHIHPNRQFDFRRAFYGISKPIQPGLRQLWTYHKLLF